jgi:hypothetical protein
MGEERSQSREHQALGVKGAGDIARQKEVSQVLIITLPPLPVALLRLHGDLSKDSLWLGVQQAWPVREGEWPSVLEAEARFSKQSMCCLQKTQKLRADSINPWKLPAPRCRPQASRGVCQTAGALSARGLDLGIHALGWESLTLQPHRHGLGASWFQRFLESSVAEKYVTEELSPEHTSCLPLSHCHCYR